MRLSAKKNAVIRRLEGWGGVVVALSGGVDSALLLALAVAALGRERVLAATGESPSLAGGELDAARAIAESLGARHEVLRTRELQRAGYRANLGDRCFHCRTELFERLGRLALERGLPRVAYGAIADDLADDRPGMRAAERFGVLAPLLEAGLTKPEVRALAAATGLSVRDKPASACLASRIPVGIPVTVDRLASVDRAEAALRRLGFRQLRVRHHGEFARLELDPAGLRRISDPGLRSAAVAAVRAAGFRSVTIDPDGYRPGGAGRA